MSCTLRRTTPRPRLDYNKLPLNFIIVAFNRELENRDGIEDRLENAEVLATFAAFAKFVELNGGPRTYHRNVMSRFSLWDIPAGGGRLKSIVKIIKSRGLSWRRIMEFMIVANLTDSWEEFYEVQPHLKSLDEWIQRNGGWKGFRKYVRTKLSASAERPTDTKF